MVIKRCNKPLTYLLNLSDKWIARRLGQVGPQSESGKAGAYEGMPYFTAQTFSGVKLLNLHLQGCG
jgi:hypothetical protein